MTRERVVPVVLSVLVIVVVAVVQERSRHLAAIVATMPVTAPLAMWIVFSATRGDHGQTADFAASMFGGLVGELGVRAAHAGLGFRQQWSFPLVLAFGAAVLARDRVAPRPGWALASVRSRPETGSDHFASHTFMKVMSSYADGDCL